MDAVVCINSCRLYVAVVPLKHTAFAILRKLWRTALAKIDSEPQGKHLVTFGNDMLSCMLI